jgi:SpoVK/Ycf46/Vps4 family AAA+-type ATPase
VRRLYIPLPERASRVALLRHLLGQNPSEVTAAELEELGTLTNGYSGADVRVLALARN